MDAGGGRTPDERLNELIEKAWGYDSESESRSSTRRRASASAFTPICRFCGEPVSMAGGRLHHEMPRNATWEALAYLAGRTAHEPKIA